MIFRKRVAVAVGCGLMMALTISCATYQAKQQPARQNIRNKQFTDAIQKLEEQANKDGGDQLVYLLDYATALQLAGRYSESNKAFEKADKISEVQDYHSLSRVIGSVVAAEELMQYKGEDFEKVLINALAAINYLELGQLDEALVEVRRLNNKLYKYKYEAKRNYEQNAFAFYISAAIWEADQKWDDAYIAYKSAYEVAPGFPLLKTDLMRAARQAQRTEDYKKWRTQFPDVDPGPPMTKSQGELFVVFQQGWGPRKKPRPEFPRLPMLVPLASDTVQAEVQITPVGTANTAKLLQKTNARTPAAENNATAQISATKEGNGLNAGQFPAVYTETVHSVEQVAIKSFEDQYAELVAKRVGGVVAKEVVADQVRQKNELLGMIVWVALHATDRADLRQWSTLPESFQIARVILPVGKYKVRIQGMSSNKQPTGETSDDREIEILPRKKTFVSWRSTQ